MRILIIPRAERREIFQIISKRLLASVARWYIFKEKNPNLGKFPKVTQWKMLVFLATFVHFIVKLYTYFMAIWYIFSVLVCRTDKNLAALLLATRERDYANKTNLCLRILHKSHRLL
jgi:hypothetical protein